jgi:DNA invertase Pin-like site-specific DNA recombinase
MAVWLAYCRKSRIAAGTRMVIESTDRQRDRTRAWAEARGASVEFFVEPDGHRSGTTVLHRPQYQRMLERIRTAPPGVITGVVVTKIDRTSRNPSDFFAFLGELQQHRLEYAALDQSFDTTTPHGRLILGVLILLAEWEAEMAADRIREAIGDKRDRGYYVGPNVYGYDRAQLLSEQGILRTLVPNPVEEERLRAIIRRCLEAGEGEAAMSRWLNALGWPTKRGGVWTRATVEGVLDNAMFYAGYVLLYDDHSRRRRRALPGQHPPLIDVETAQEVERRRRQRASAVSGRPPRINHFALTGHIWCGECGGRMVGGGIRGGKLVYRCRKDRVPCHQHLTPALAVEAEVWTRLRDLAGRLACLVDVQEELTMQLAARTHAPPPPRPSNADETREEIRRLDYLFLKRRIDEDAYERERAALEQELANATQAPPRADDPMMLGAARAMLGQLDAVIARGSRESLRAFAGNIIRRVVVQDGHVTELHMAPELQIYMEV